MVINKARLWTVLAAVALSLTFSTSSRALTPWWAFGQIDFVQQTQGVVTIALKSSALVGCQADRVYLRDSLLGEKLVDRALSLSLAAQASGREMGIVIDLDVKNQGGECRALGNMLIRDVL